MPPSLVRVGGVTGWGAVQEQGSVQSDRGMLLLQEVQGRWKGEVEEQETEPKVIRGSMSPLSVLGMRLVVGARGERNCEIGGT